MSDVWKKIKRDIGVSWGEQQAIEMLRGDRGRADMRGANDPLGQMRLCAVCDNAGNGAAISPSQGAAGSRQWQCWIAKQRQRLEREA